MSTPPGMMPRAMSSADRPEDAARAMGPVESGSSRGASERKRQSGAKGDAEPSAAELAEALFLTTHALKHTGQHCMGEADSRLRAISFPRARLLMALDDAKQGRVRMGDLSQALGVTARNITTIVDGLEREGLIGRRPDPTDRRAILIMLTPEGQEYIAQVHAIQREIAESFFAALDPGERAEMLRLLAKIREGAAPREGGATE